MSTFTILEFNEYIFILKLDKNKVGVFFIINNNSNIFFRKTVVIN